MDKQNLLARRLANIKNVAQNMVEGRYDDMGVYAAITFILAESTIEIPHGRPDFTLEECGCCSCYHRPGYTGDCRNDAERFSDYAALAREYWKKAIGDFLPVAVKEDKVMVEFENIGEGLSGDYNEDDEQDIPVLRFGVYKRSTNPLPAFDKGIPKPEDQWESVDDASYSTKVPVDTPKESLEKMARLIMDRVKQRVLDYSSVKKLCEQLSWIQESWVV